MVGNIRSITGRRKSPLGYRVGQGTTLVIRFDRCRRQVGAANSAFPPMPRGRPYCIYHIRIKATFGKGKSRTIVYQTFTLTVG